VKKCPYCHFDNEDGTQICEACRSDVSNCAEQLPKEMKPYKVKCPHCGAIESISREPGRVFTCTSCNNKYRNPPPKPDLKFDCDPDYEDGEGIEGDSTSLQKEHEISCNSEIILFFDCNQNCAYEYKLISDALSGNHGRANAQRMKERLRVFRDFFRAGSRRGC
jgi:hypothetical protein